MADPLAQTMAFDGDAGGAAPPVTVTADSGPRVLAGRYEILGLIGTGGMGNVYRARDRELEEFVALKVLRPEIAGNAAALSRFRSEVKLARRVTHPNVARVFDIGDEGGEKYLTMELVDGESLGALLLRVGRLPVARAVEIAGAVCAGLGAAHAAGVVHCDLKPDNVMLGPDGRVVVTDFGIARAVAAEAAKVTGTITGTPAYMAPEQVEGKATDARTDIYALGAVLYEVLTGEAPWRGDSVMAVAVARLLEPPPDPRARRPEIGRELGAVVVRCLARNPEERFADVAEVARELGAAAEKAPTPVAISLPPARMPEPAMLMPTGPARTQLAVLPFRNVGPREQDYVADGLTEDLIDLLSGAEGLRVRSRGTVMRYRGGERDPREIGRELAVQVIVEGSIRRGGGAVRVAVRLVSVVDGVQIWHRRFDRPEGEIFAISDAAARAIAEALAAELPVAARDVPTSAEAIDLYLRARSFYLRFFADLRGDSVILFEQALALAPDDPRILAGYAMAMGRFWTGGGDHLERARRAAERAAERAPNLADGHAALAMVLYQERREAEAVLSLSRALRVSRHNAEAHDMMGRILAETELQGPAQRHLETALSLEPELQLSRALLARLHMLRGDWGAADAVVESTDDGELALLPSVARMCLWRRDTERAQRLLVNEDVQRDPSWTLTGVVLEAVANRRWPKRSPPAPGNVTQRFFGFVCQIRAELAMFLGEEERGIAAVEEAASAGIFDVAWADRCPLLAPIREADRFRAARAKIAARAQGIADVYASVTAGAPQPLRS